MYDNDVGALGIQLNALARTAARIHADAAGHEIGPITTGGYGYSMGMCRLLAQFVYWRWGCDLAGATVAYARLLQSNPTEAQFLSLLYTTNPPVGT